MEVSQGTGAEEHPIGTDGFPYRAQHDEAPFPGHCYRRTFTLRYLGLPPSPANNSSTHPIYRPSGTLSS
ncbi:MAG: hypothetical protein M3315_16910 [Actinomycetota bacterium]|nr:hypothetical protein [Actinomycetota bacterium]MDQ3920815.1 hypothetical protein [Actinomycetota bacterium]